MQVSDNIDVNCVREIPFKSEIVPFLNNLYHNHLKKAISGSRHLQDKEFIRDAMRGQPLYVRIKCLNASKFIDPKFIRVLKGFFQREVIARMHLKKGEVTLVLFQLP